MKSIPALSKLSFSLERVLKFVVMCSSLFSICFIVRHPTPLGLLGVSIVHLSPARVILICCGVNIDVNIYGASGAFCDT